MLVFFLCQSTHLLYISPETRLKERCPKECVYKLPVNTLTHTLMHAHAPTVYIPLVSSLRASRHADTHAPSAQPRRGTFGSSGKKQTKQKCRMLSFVIFCFFKSKHIRVQFGILPGTKTSQQVKVPSLFFYLSSSINTVWPLGENIRGEGARVINPQRLELHFLQSQLWHRGNHPHPPRLNSGQRRCLWEAEL